MIIDLHYYPKYEEQVRFHTSCTCTGVLAFEISSLLDIYRSSFFLFGNLIFQTVQWDWLFSRKMNPSISAYLLQWVLQASLRGGPSILALIGQWMFPLSKFF